MRRAAAVAVFIFVSNPVAYAQSGAPHCAGDILRIFRDPPFGIAVNSRVEQGTDYKMAYTCVENLTTSRTTVSWPVPGHYSTFTGLGIPHESPRPFPIDTSLTLIPGCLYYGQSQSTRHADVG